MTDRDLLVFAPEPELETPADEPWKIVIADDEEEVHQVTKLALANLRFEGRPVKFLDAYSGRETVELLRREPDVAILFLDVVMETETAGLEAVDAIRRDLNNRFVRIVLRTGQPGQAPERDVVLRYDINDYKEKTELTAKKLFTAAYTGLSLYRDLRALEKSRTSLEEVIFSSATIFRRRSPERLARGVLQRLSGMLGLDQGGASGHGLAVLLPAGANDGLVLAGTGAFAKQTGKRLLDVMAGDEAQRILAAPGPLWVEGHGYFAAHIAQPDQTRTVFYLPGPARVPDGAIMNLFCNNVVIAMQNARTNQEIEKTQRELIIMLSEAIEKRSKETGNHVRRVAEYSRLLALLAGLSEAQAAVLQMASPLHDAGKIGIPDAILNKPGKHTPDEDVVMKTHAQMGSDMFESQDLPVLKAAAIVAGQHHERWDGLGYPQALKGEDIHIYGRITALADVFDALGSERCYKKPWELEDILDLVRAERGRHFDPRLVDLLLANLDQFIAVRDRLADPADRGDG